jgi:hypothetical protein
MQGSDGGKAEAESFRKIAFCGVALSTIATLLCVIIVPTFYGYMQQVQSTMASELEFCKLRSSNIWQEVARTQVLSTRHPRQAGYGYGQKRGSGSTGRSYGQDAAVQSFGGGSCCGCGISPPGPPG